MSHVWYHELSNSDVPDAVVSSVGPPVGSFNFHSADLQVLSWDKLAGRWIVAFDAQRITASNNYFVEPTTSNSAIYAPPPSSTPTATTPLLDPKGDVGIDQVAFVRFAPRLGDTLVFAASTSYGGSGVGSQLNVVSFKGGEANILYSWTGEGLYPFHISGSHSSQALSEKAEYWTLEDPHCCPARTYRFTIASAGKASSPYITDVKDERPWLGIYVKPLDSQDQSTSLVVVGVVPDSPASRVLRKGDVIQGLANAPPLVNTTLNGPSLVDKLSLLDAGDTASLVVRRGFQTATMRVHLGSMIDPSALVAAPPAGDYSIATI